MHNFYQAIKQVIIKITSILMLGIMITFLAISAILIQYLQTAHGFKSLYYAEDMINILLMLWPAFIIERLLYLLFCCKKTGKNLLIALIVILVPPLHLASRHCHDKEYIFWGLEWRLIDQALYAHIEKKFLYPILVVSFLMIPFWITEIIFSKISHLWLFHLLNFGNAIIWSLFVAEFIILCSISKKPLKYVTTHWLELSIIILPMLALARFIVISKYLQFSKATYLLVKIQNILNIYRARSVINRIIRILIIIDIVRRFYQRKNPQKYLEMLQDKLEDKEQEVAEIKQQITEIKALIKPE